MFSDTHCHLPLVAERMVDFNTADFFSSLCRQECAFLQDVGTQCDDLGKRISFVAKAISDGERKGILSKYEVTQLHRMIHFSAGIWPSAEAITNRVAQLKVLEEQIETLSKTKSMSASDDSSDAIAAPIISAIGECGLDHHWNPSGEDGRCETDFDQNMFDGERALFINQIVLAQRMSLPVIVHSRDAFEDTLSCIQEGGYDVGVIHCFAYGKEEASSFLDRGWYISLSGSVTYTKKSKMEAMEKLIRYIPDDRLLLETDSPYLAPAPCRGQPCTPLLVQHTYRFVSQIRGISLEKLCGCVDDNAKRLFVK